MYSLDLRKVACSLYQKYCSARKVALILEVSHSSICRWVKNIQRKRYSRKPKLCSDFVIDTIKTSLSINPFHSIRSLVQKVKEVCNILVSRELIRCAILKIGFSKKKCKHRSLSIVSCIIIASIHLVAKNVEYLVVCRRPLHTSHQKNV
jgi:hypothetical protein